MTEPIVPLTERVPFAPITPTSGRGRRHGTSNSQPFDRWFRYPAGFASDYATTLLGYLNLPSGGTILDCFAGSGVAGTAARSIGLGFVGIEAHPLIAELAELKLSHPPGPSTNLGSAAAETVIAANKLVSRRQGARSAAAKQPDLVQRCFSPGDLEQLVALRDAIKKNYSAPWSPYLKWALLASLRDLAAVKVGWPYQRPGVQRKQRYNEPMQRFIARIRLMQDDLSKSAKLEARTSASMICGDSRTDTAWESISPGSIDGCLSSPPYLNNFDYADATRLELYFWGDVTSWAEMCKTVRSGMVTATTQQSSVNAASTASSGLAQLGKTFTRIEDITSELEIQRKSRGRGKEYDRVVPDYFLGILDVLSRLAKVLESGAPSVWLIGDSAPYGVYIDTPALIGEIAEHLGFRVEEDLALRQRGLRWASTGMRHDIELTERLLLFRRD